MHQPRLLVLCSTSAVLAAFSVLLAFEPVYDPWAWLIWGREVIAFDLDTSAGPSWKPLPVAVTALASPFGEQAPDIWLGVARFGWLLSAGLVGRLAVRLVTGGPGLKLLAGLTAALSLILIADDFTPWFVQFSGGLSEPLLAALILLAIDRELDSHRGAALASGFAATLIRPEAWPFFWAYAVIVSRRLPTMRAPALILSVLVLVLWFVPDVLGAGNPFEGASRARQDTGAPLAEALEAVGRAAAMPLAALWLLAIGFAWVEARAGHRVPAVLLLAAGGWVALVAVGSAVGYAGLPRFMVPAAALACVLGGAGMARMVGAAVDWRASTNWRASGMRLARGRVLVLTVVLGLAIVGQAVERASRFPSDIREASAFHRSVVDLFTTARMSAPVVSRCGDVTVSELTVQSALAWALERPLAEVDIRVRSAPQRGTAFVDRRHAAAVQASSAGGRAIISNGQWTVYEVGCPGDPAVTARRR